MVLLLPVGWTLQRASALLAPDAVERWYARGVFPWIRSALSRASALSPCSAGELLVLLIVLAVGGRSWFAFRAWRLGRRTAGSALGAWMLDLLAAAGVLYAVFLALWGALHARPPLADRLGITRVERSVEDLTSLASALIRIADQRRVGLDEDDSGVFRFQVGREDVVRRCLVAIEQEVVPGIVGARPVVRVPWSAPLLSALGISGIYSPFTGEAHVNGQIEDASFPFTLLHELAHAAGEAREDEANFTAWRWCEASGDRELRYSGAFAALGYVLAALASVDRPAYDALSSTMSEGLHRDRLAVREFWRAHRSPLTAVSSGVNDVYLRSQGQADGVRSYGQMIDLLLAMSGRGNPRFER